VTKLFLKCFIKDDFILFPNHAFSSFTPCLRFPRSIRSTRSLLGSRVTGTQGTSGLLRAWLQEASGSQQRHQGLPALDEQAGLCQTPLRARSRQPPGCAPKLPSTLQIRGSLRLKAAAPGHDAQSKPVPSPRRQLHARPTPVAPCSVVRFCH